MNKIDLFNKVKVRRFPEKNYNAIWHNLKTVRLGEGVAEELEPEYSEFYDVSIGNKCTTGKCPFCYVASNPNGRFYEDICETWIKWMNSFPEDLIDEKTGIIKTYKPFQIAIGSEGSADEHPDFCRFLKTVFNTGVLPNYTTNGVLLADECNARTRQILDYTERYVGGVAVSFGNKLLRDYAKRAINNLLYLNNVKVNIHHIISDKESVDDFFREWIEYGDSIYYHVLLPLMPAGRSKEGMVKGTWDYLEEVITSINMNNVSFGAHFVKYLEKSNKIKTWLYPPESLSKNILLKKDKVVITPSSFDLKPIKIINL